MTTLLVRVEYEFDRVIHEIEYIVENKNNKYSKL